MKINLIVALVVTFLFGCTQSPSQTNSHITSERAFIVFNGADNTMHYEVAYALKGESATPHYYIHSFEIPGRNAEPDIVKGEIASGQTRFSLRSRDFRNIDEERYYQCRIDIYADATRSEKITSYSHKVKMSYPWEIINRLPVSRY